MSVIVIGVSCIAWGVVVESHSNMSQAAVLFDEDSGAELINKEAWFVGIKHL